ncbi:MAG: DUF6088 family protein [Alphaproteobacteria bacterium]|nr:DUF6088 family protein [Alphaproteobacteria bacterium]
MKSITNQIINRIKRRKPGWVFTPRDFLDVGSRAAVDQVMSRLVKQGLVRRLDRGIYYYPKHSKLLGALSPTPDNIARALAPNDRIFATGAMAANLLGLSTQVPIKIAYLTNATSCTRKVAGQTIQLKRARIPWLDAIPDHANLTLQALSYLGRHSIDDQIISRCAHVLCARDIKGLQKAMLHIPGWMADVIHKIEQRIHNKTAT